MFASYFRRVAADPARVYKTIQSSVILGAAVWAMTKTDHVEIDTMGYAARSMMCV